RGRTHVSLRSPPRGPGAGCSGGCGGGCSGGCGGEHVSSTGALAPPDDICFRSSRTQALTYTHLR
ncbi:MAG TPA: hypothetical protein VIJ54_05100, partial [Actinomycetes bacterium]